MSEGKRLLAWGSATLVFLLIIAAWSRISTLSEGPKTIDAGANALSSLFKGVFQ